MDQDLKVELFNLTNRKTSQLSDFIDFVFPKELRGQILIEIHKNAVNYIDGERKENKNLLWDATAYQNNHVIVGINENLIEHTTGWPTIWEREETKLHYIEGTVFYDYEELCIYCLAHELWHLYQWQIKDETSLVRHLFHNADGETDADMYAIAQLFNWRKKQEKELEKYG